MNTHVEGPIAIVKEVSSPPTVIHLLYAPTIFCNLGCHYCYLGTQTERALTSNEEEAVTATLELALAKLKEENMLAFNVSLHGGEFSTLKIDLQEALFQIIKEHYAEHKVTLNSMGFRKDKPHIKTNLYQFEKFYELYDAYGVSISASIDIPLRLHHKYRTTKGGRSTLEKTIENLKLLKSYPHRKKLSATLFSEHMENVDELMADILYLHNEIGFDMNEFNFMFGFESVLAQEKNQNVLPPELHQVTEKQMVELYEKLKGRFLKTPLERGFKENWFDEFMPTYCTNALNCGEKFFLLQSDGNIFSCVRGQGNQPFHYGNIYEDTWQKICQTGKRKIIEVHQAHGLHEDCQKCEYLAVCHTGCAFVKTQKNNGKSYTCALQKKLYEDNKEKYPPSPKNVQSLQLLEYQAKIHPQLLEVEYHMDSNKRSPQLILPNDLYDAKNSLNEIIDGDEVLKVLYDDKAFILKWDEQLIPLSSQILKQNRDIYQIDDSDQISLLIRKNIFQANCREVVRNTLYLQMLRDTKVVYGDEKRQKQEHTFTYQYFHDLLKSYDDEYDEFDLMGLIQLHQHTYIENVSNHLFFTTSALREYHYEKQKNNGFYHIQALNLPFQDFEFHWLP